MCINVSKNKAKWVEVWGKMGKNFGALPKRKMGKNFDRIRQALDSSVGMLTVGPKSLPCLLVLYVML